MQELEVLYQVLFEAAGTGRHQGEEMAALEGQTQGRWQTMWMVATEPLTVPQVARRLGVTRQNVQRTVGELARDGLLELHDNPDHKTSPLLSLTDQGLQVLHRINHHADATHHRMLAHFPADSVPQLRQLLTQFTQAIRSVPVGHEADNDPRPSK